ncbi:MAG: hypothetical protein SNG14_07080 [Rikenellaceae bacterium]
MTQNGMEWNNPGNIPVRVSHIRGEIARDGVEAEYLFDNAERLGSGLLARDLAYLGRYKWFRTLDLGCRAMFLILYNFSELYEDNTVIGLISRWCTMSGRENVLPIGDYAKAVAKRLGRTITGSVDTSDPEDMKQLICSISRIECGEEPDKETLDEAWNIFNAGARF